MKIQNKITAASMALVVLALIAFLATIVVQRQSLGKRLEAVVREQGAAEAGKIVHTLYLSCEAAESRNQTRLTHDLDMAREILARSGAVSLGTDPVEWKAVNQITKEGKSIQLPQVLVGTNWLGQNFSTNQPSPVVDEARHLTLDHCTVFQRMNDNGDMLRVCTSIVGANGSRAVGTYIPRQNSDGSPNPVVETVLKGQTYRGRAFVVNEYHATAYEPLWDATRSRVIGMLYVGVPMTDINKEFHDSMTKIVVGKTGYVFVLGGKGDQKGKYIVSKNGARDGEAVWDMRDANGKLVIQSLVAKALETTNGSCAAETYSWKNSDEKSPRDKFASVSYFAAWDWVIGAGAYQEDYAGVILEVAQALGQLVKWTSVAALIVGVVGFCLSHFVSAGITRPIMRIIEQLKLGADQTASAAGQISGAGQSLAEGASEQAASLEETSSSLEELSSMTQRNSENARKANDLAKEARSAAENGAHEMQSMSSAMMAIKVSSDDIAKIIKTIDEIAFQTNILALNAAVEAARAGEAGMGFAVVADEVRNLAQRSASAAKETAAKIEGAIAKTTQGVAISDKVEHALGDIVAKVRQVDELVAEVANASREQTQGISQINTAVGQMDKVTQSNAASAEESASAAEQMNSQAELTKDSVGDLLKLISGKSEAATGKGSRERHQPHVASPMPVAKPRGANGVSHHSNGHGADKTAPVTIRHAEIPMDGNF